MKKTILLFSIPAVMLMAASCGKSGNDYPAPDPGPDPEPDHVPTWNITDHAVAYLDITGTQTWDTLAPNLYGAAFTVARDLSRADSVSAEKKYTSGNTVLLPEQLGPINTFYTTNVDTISFFVQSANPTLANPGPVMFNVNMIQMAYYKASEQGGTGKITLTRLPANVASNFYHRTK